MSRILLLLLVGCAHRVPAATMADPELCIGDATTQAEHVAPHGDRVGVCFGVDCLVLDHVRGRVVDRATWPHPEQQFPAALALHRRVEEFELERTETETSVCNRDRVCRTLQLPDTDQRTVMPAISGDGKLLYYVAREGAQAFLDTISVGSVGPRARRLGRVPLAVGDAREHMFSVERVGSAILVRDSIVMERGEVSSYILVDPFTGAQRVLIDGTAIELDEHAALVLERKRATIVNTRALATLATLDVPARAVVNANGAVAAVAFANPPTVVIVERQRFTRTWRLPVCR